MSLAEHWRYLGKLHGEDASLPKLHVLSQMEALHMLP